MRKNSACMLLSLCLSMPLFAERAAPKITPQPNNTEEKEVPIALQKSHPEETNIANVETPNRIPTEAPKEATDSLISHSLEVPNLEEYKEAFQNGDKTSATINATEPVQSE